MRPKFTLFNQAGVRHLVHEGTRAVTIDGKSAYNQFCYSIEVGMYHCVYTPLGWCRVKRAAMGARPSAFIADTCLGVLAEKCRSLTKTYIDNLLLIHTDDDVLIKDLQDVKERADYVNYTFNEDLNDPASLIKSELEFLGTILDFEGKTVRLADKVIKKLASCWARQRETPEGEPVDEWRWTVRDFIVCVCILVYTANVLGRSMSEWQVVLQAWARLQGEAMFDPDSMDATLEELPEAIMTPLKEWVGVTLTNDPLPVEKPGGDKHDFVVVTLVVADGPE